MNLWILVFTGLWGAFTLALILMLIGKWFQAIEAESTKQIAIDRLSVSEQNREELIKILNETLARPVIAALTNDQVDRLAQDLKARMTANLSVN